MASVQQTGKFKGKRSLDAEINLVPFIDLLSMCICFLLMTAVWIQIGSVQVKQSHGTEASTPSADSTEISVRMITSLSSEITLKKSNGKVLQKVQINGTAEEDYRRNLKSQIAAIAPQPALVSSAMVNSKSTVTYNELVWVLDALRSHQIVNVGITPEAGVK